MQVNITLRKWYRYTFSIKPLFDGTGYIPINIPVIIGFNPWPNDKINSGIG